MVNSEGRVPVIAQLESPKKFSDGSWATFGGSVPATPEDVKSLCVFVKSKSGLTTEREKTGQTKRENKNKKGKAKSYAVCKDVSKLRLEDNVPPNETSLNALSNPNQV